MNSSGQRLFSLLPALYRLRDARLAQSQNLLNAPETAQLQALQSSTAPLTASQQSQLDQLTAKAARGPLQCLLMLIEEQVAAVANDLDQLYDDQFIETCAPWVIPYIGDLIGYQAIYGKAATVATPRAEVANTISFRRRKGTVLVMEQLARDVTGWGAHAVEFFKRLADTQYMKHVRPHNHYAPNLRRWEPRAYMNSGFDATAHKVDVRRIAVGRGRYNIQNIGVFLWSLNAYTVTNSPAQQAKDTKGSPCFRFSSLGRDMPLFNLPVSQGPDITVAAQPVNVPDRLKRHVLCKDLQGGAGAAYYGQGKSLALYSGGLLEPGQIQICDLSGEEGKWINVPTGSQYAAAIDPDLGRIALPPGSSSQLSVSYCYGFNGNMGGGEYPRPDPATDFPSLTLTKISGAGADVQAALTALASTGGVVEITDSGVYQFPASGTTLAGLNLGAQATLELAAAPGFRPTLVLGGGITVTGGTGSVLNLKGILVCASSDFAKKSAGAALITVPASTPSGSPNQLSELNLTDCTLVPGWALKPNGEPHKKSSAQPVLSAAAAGLAISAATSILGGIRAELGVTANFTDSIIDATDPTNIAYSAADQSGGGSLTLQNCTVIGKVHVSLLSLASNCIFWSGLQEKDPFQAPLWADRKQQGCVRFSYLPGEAIIPRNFGCVTAAIGKPGPLFESLRYGDPGYGKVMASTDDSIRRGADDGGEMGAFHFVYAPLRETDLRVRLQEYMPVGLEFGILYQT